MMSLEHITKEALDCCTANSGFWKSNPHVLVSRCLIPSHAMFPLEGSWSHAFEIQLRESKSSDWISNQLKFIIRACKIVSSSRCPVDEGNLGAAKSGALCRRKLHQNPPFKAEHLGSLLRPEYLLEARKAAEEQSANPGALKSAEDKAIEDIVHAQLDIGFNSISDGEYRRHSKEITDQSFGCYR